MSFVPDGFVPPSTFAAEDLRLVPLTPEHNEADYAAWASSIEHIRATPGFASRNWPAPMSLAQNRRDLEGHARDFEARTGFTYTVLDGSGDVVGCVYIYPSSDEGSDAEVRSWVRASRSELDRPLWQAVRAWLEASWPFTAVRYAAR
jgi:hypothetical protein